MATPMKGFFDVVTELRVDEKLRKIFDCVYVRDIVYSKGSKHLEFQLSSNDLIHYTMIKQMTDLVKNKLFPTTDVTIALKPLFTCIEPLGLEVVCNQYKESVLTELLETKPSLYLTVQNAAWRVTHNQITVVLENTYLAHTRSRELQLFLESVYKERFDAGIEINLDYTHHLQESTSLIEENEQRLTAAVGHVMEQAKSGSEVVEEPSQNAEGFKKDKDKSQEKQNKYRRAPKDPDVFYGRECEGEVTPIEEITDEIGEVVIEGKVLSLETREIRMEKTILIFDVTNFKDTITIKLFIKNEELPEVLESLKKGQFYRIKGLAVFDKFDKEISIGGIQGIKPIQDFTSTRQDTSEEKRIELHLHTVMSDMDSVVDIGKMIARAKAWGMPAIAITDHGCLQAFPIANHCVKKDEPFKVIYGVEAYFVDDTKEIVVNAQAQSLRDSYVVFDIETTGFSPVYNKIIEIGAVKIVEGEIVGRFSEFVNPQIPIPKEIEVLTGITDHMVKDSETIEAILPRFLTFCEGSILVAHNAEFDMSFIRANATKQGRPFEATSVDTVGIARVLLPHLGNAKLGNIAKHLGIK